MADLSLDSSSALMLSGTVIRPRGFSALTSSSTVIFSFPSFSRISAGRHFSIISAARNPALAALDNRPPSLKAGSDLSVREMLEVEL